MSLARSEKVLPTSRDSLQSSVSIADCDSVGGYAPINLMKTSSGFAIKQSSSNYSICTCYEPDPQLLSSASDCDMDSRDDVSPRSVYKLQAQEYISLVYWKRKLFEKYFKTWKYKYMDAVRQIQSANDFYLNRLDRKMDHRLSHCASRVSDPRKSVLQDTHASIPNILLALGLGRQTASPDQNHKTCHLSLNAQDKYNAGSFIPVAEEVRGCITKVEETRDPVLVSDVSTRTSMNHRQQYNSYLRFVYFAFKKWRQWTNNQISQKKRHKALASKFAAVRLQRLTFTEWRTASKQNVHIRLILSVRGSEMHKNMKSQVLRQFSYYSTLRRRSRTLQNHYVSKLIITSIRLWRQRVLLISHIKTLSDKAKQFARKKLFRPFFEKWCNAAREFQQHRKLEHTAATFSSDKLLRRVLDEWKAYTILVSFRCVSESHLCEVGSFVSLQDSVQRQIQLMLYLHQWKRKFADNTIRSCNKLKAQTFMKLRILRHFFSIRWLGYFHRREKHLRMADKNAQSVHRKASQYVGIHALQRYAKTLQHYKQLQCRAKQSRLRKLLFDILTQWRRKLVQSRSALLLYTKQQRRTAGKCFVRWKQHHIFSELLIHKSEAVIDACRESGKFSAWKRWKCLCTLRKSILSVTVRCIHMHQKCFWQKWKLYTQSSIVIRHKILQFRRKAISKFCARPIFDEWCYHISRKRCESRMARLFQKKSLKTKVRRAVRSLTQHNKISKWRRKKGQQNLMHILQSWRLGASITSRTSYAQYVAKMYYMASRFGTSIARWKCFHQKASYYNSRNLVAREHLQESLSRKLLNHWLYQVIRGKSIRQYILEKREMRCRVKAMHHWQSWITYVAMQQRTKKQQIMMQKRVEQKKCHVTLIKWISFAWHKRDLNYSYAAVVNKISHASCAKVYQSWYIFVACRRALYRQQITAAHIIKTKYLRKTTKVLHCYSFSKLYGRAQIQKAVIFHGEYLKCLIFVKWSQFYYTGCSLRCSKSRFLADRCSATVYRWLLWKKHVREHRLKSGAVIHIMKHRKIVATLRKWRILTLQHNKVKKMCFMAKSRHRGEKLINAWLAWIQFFDRMNLIKRKLLFAFAADSSSKLQVFFTSWTRCIQVEHQIRDFNKYLCHRTVRHWYKFCEGHAMTQHRYYEQVQYAESFWRIKRLKDSIRSFRCTLPVRENRTKAIQFLRAKRLQQFYIWKSKAEYFEKRRTKVSRFIDVRIRAINVNTFEHWKREHIKFRLDYATRAQRFCQNSYLRQYLCRWKKYHAWAQKVMAIIKLQEKLNLQKYFGMWRNMHCRIQRAKSKLWMTEALSHRLKLHSACSKWHKWAEKRQTYAERTKHARIMYHWCLLLHSWNEWKMYHDGCHQQFELAINVQRCDRQRYFRMWRMTTMRNIELDHFFDSFHNECLLKRGIQRWIRCKNKCLEIREQYDFADYCNRLRQLCIGLTSFTEYHQQQSSIRISHDTARSFNLQKRYAQVLHAWNEAAVRQKQYKENCAKLSKWILGRKVQVWYFYKQLWICPHVYDQRYSKSLYRRSVKAWSDFVKSKRTKTRLRQIYSHQLCVTSWRIWNSYTRLSRISSALRRKEGPKKLQAAFTVWTYAFDNHCKAKTHRRCTLMKQYYRSWRWKVCLLQVRKLKWTRATELHAIDSLRHRWKSWTSFVRQRFTKNQRCVVALRSMAQFAKLHVVRTWRELTALELKRKTQIVMIEQLYHCRVKRNTFIMWQDLFRLHRSNSARAYVTKRAPLPAHCLSGHISNVTTTVYYIIEHFKRWRRISECRRILRRCCKQKTSRLMKHLWQLWTIQIQQKIHLHRVILHWESVTSEIWIYKTFGNFLQSKKRSRNCRNAISRWKCLRKLSIYIVPKPPSTISMTELENKLVETLQALPLHLVTESESIKLLQSGGTASISHEERILKAVNSNSLRQLEFCLQHYQYYEIENERKNSRFKLLYKNKPSKSFWELLTLRDTYVRVIDTDCSERGSLHSNVFAVLHVLMKASSNFNQTPKSGNVEKTCRDVCTEESDNLVIALCAARIYLIWTQLPGGSAYGIFMPYQYLRIMGIINGWMDNLLAVATNTSKSRQTENDEILKEAEDNACKRLRKCGADILEELQRFLRCVSLRTSHDCIASTAECVIYMQRVSQQVSYLLNVNQLCLKVLKNLQSDLHGDMQQLTRILIHIYIPGITLQESSRHEIARQPRNILHYHRLSIIAVEQILNHLAEYLQEMEIDAELSGNQKSNDVMSEIHLSLLQNVCLNVHDRAEKRQKSLVYFLDIALCRDLERSSFRLCPSDRAHLIRFLSSYSKQKYTRSRVFAVELVANLLLKPQFWNCIASDVPENMQQYTGAAPLLRILLDRSNDRISNVRAKAISGISSAIALSLKPNDTSAFEKGHVEGTEIVHLGEREVNELRTSLKKLLMGEQSLAGHAYLNKLDVDLLKLFRASLNDDKVSVRRAAIRALEALLVSIPPLIHSNGGKEFYDLQERCGDASLLVRVQAVKSLSSLLRLYPENKDAQNVWLLGVLPLYVDPEPSVQKCVLDAIHSNIFEQLFAWFQLHQTESQSVDKGFIWQLIEQLDDAMTRCCQRALRKLIASSNIDQYQLVALSMHLIKLSVSSTATKIPDQHEVDVASVFWNFGWALLEEITRFSNIIPCIDTERSKYLDIVITCWNKLQNGELSSFFSEGAKRVLRVIATLAPIMQPHDAKRIADSILASLSSFSTPINVISNAVLALHAICKAKASDTEEGYNLSRAWGGKLMELCEEKLQYATSHPQLLLDDPVSIEKQLLLLGEMAMLEFNKEADKIEHPSTIALLPFTPLAKALVQLFLSDKLSHLNTCGESTQLKQEGDLIEVPVSVRICAFLTLGKICLRDEDFAKGCITMLIRELRTGKHHKVRSNVLLILGDLCIRYTGLIDTYVPTITLSILDESPLIRRTAVLLLSQLILQDYVKWKDSVQRCFFNAVVDDVEEIASLVKYILRGPILRKFPNLFINKFTDLIFVLNMCKHKQHPDDLESEVSAKCALLGESFVSKRMAIYTFMLEQLQDEQKLRVSMKLCTEILEEVVEDRLQLCKNPTHITDSGTEAVLKDTFLILCSPAIKLARSNEKDDDDDDDNGDVEADPSSVSSQIAAAKGKLLSKLSKKNFLENIVPLLIGMKQKLESKHSPLMRYLLGCTRQLFGLYKDEVREILSADPQMAIEIDYDLRQYELQQAREETDTTTIGKPGAANKVSERRRSLQSPSLSNAIGISMEGAKAALAKTPIKHKTVSKWNVPEENSSSIQQDCVSATLLFSPNKSDKRTSGEWKVNTASFDKLIHSESPGTAELSDSIPTEQGQTEENHISSREYNIEDIEEDLPPLKVQRSHAQKASKNTTHEIKSMQRSKRKRDGIRRSKCNKS